jgi:hypothetical protein
VDAKDIFGGLKPYLVFVRFVYELKRDAVGENHP